MKKLLFLISLIFLTSCLEEIFSVSPYFLRTDQNEIVLKFRSKKSGDVIVKVFKKKGENNFFPLNEFKKDLLKKKVIEINLGKQLCDEEMKVTLSSSALPSLLALERSIPTYPCKKEITFGIISDTQTNKNRHRAIGEQLKTYQDLSFNLHLGDVVDYAFHQYQWKKFFDQAGPTYLEKTPILSAIGNHAFYNIFAKWVGKGPVPDKYKDYMRWDGSPEIGYISLVFPQFEMIAINSILEKLSDEQIKAQWAWLEKKLLVARALKRPIIIGMHYSPYTSSSSSFDSEAAETLRREMVPLLEKYGVKLVLTGHTHLFERLFKNGVHYIVAGPAGGRKERPDRKDEYQILVKPGVDTFGIVSINDERILVKTLNEKNEVIDSLRIDL